MTIQFKSKNAPVKTTRSDAERIAALTAQLKRHPRVDPAAIRVVKAPLRICPLGAHIDHQLGPVTGMTIDQSILLAFAPSPDGAVSVESLNFQPPQTFPMTAVPPHKHGDWGNYVRGAILALRRKYALERGLIGVISGEMPIGGLSSSAAVTLTYLLALEALNDLAISPTDNVELVRYTENEYIGLNNGILDQSVILFSRPHHLTHIDCQSLDVTQVPTPLRDDDFDILVVYSGVRRVLTGTSYNNRVAECQSAAQQLLEFVGQPVPPDVRLRLVDPVIFDAEGHRLDEILHRRARHFFGESQRVAAGVEAWQAGDLNRFGELINLSGESSVKYYESGSPQLITLYETLRQTPGVYGARFSGAGFRGCCIALTDPAARESIAEAVHERYPIVHPEEAADYSIHFCKPDGAVTLLS